MRNIIEQGQYCTLAIGLNYGKRCQVKSDLPPLPWLHTQKLAKQCAQYSAVGHNKNCLLLIMPSQTVSELADTFIQFSEALATGINQTGVPFHPHSSDLGVKLVNLVKGKPFKPAKINLPELWARYHFKIMPEGDDLRRHQRPLQVAGVNEINLLQVQSLTQTFCLSEPHIAQGDIRTPPIPETAVQFSLTMPNQQQPGQIYPQTTIASAYKPTS